MKKFCVSYISFYDNELMLEVVQAESETDAVLKASFGLAEYLKQEGIEQSLEGYKQACFNADSMVNTIEVP